MKENQSVLREILRPVVIVGALGYFVDVYDLILFSILRIPSLKSMGFTGDAVVDNGVMLLNTQMLGMLLGGIFFGILGDRLGRVALLFGSILLYSVANIANGMVHTSIDAYVVWRFIAGFGLAGELGGGITLVTEVLPRELRGYGTTLISTVGVFGAVIGGLVAQKVDWHTAYFIGGGLGLVLLVLRMSVAESGMFRHRGARSSMISFRLRPLTNSMTMYRRSPSSPTSYTDTMLGWVRFAAASASAWNRFTKSASRTRLSARTLTATFRPRLWSWAAYTDAIPPSPSGLNRR